MEFDTNEKLKRVTDSQEKKIDEVQRNHTRSLERVLDSISKIEGNVSNVGQEVIKLHGKIQVIDTKMSFLATSIELKNSTVEVKDYAREELLKHVGDKHDKKNSTAPGGDSIKITLPLKVAGGIFSMGGGGALVYYLLQMFFKP